MKNATINTPKKNMLSVGEMLSLLCGNVFSLTVRVKLVKLRRRKTRPTS